MKNYQFLQQKYMVGTYANRGITLVRGDNVYLYDDVKRQYLDMMSNYGVNILGYNNATVKQTIIKQLNTIINLHCSFNNDTRAEASEKLIKKCGEGYAQVYWANSGAEANEAALKFAVLSTGKKKFIYCNHSYHGKTLGALSVIGGEKYRQPFEPLIWATIQVPFNNAASLEKAIDTETAAFILEPIQGESGIISADHGYLKKVREICTSKGVLLIIDEIQTGTGRTGKFLASNWEKVNADILTLGKGLAGGLPVGATVINQKVAGKVARGSHTSTFGGNPLSCCATIAVTELLNEKLLNHVKTIGDYFIESLKKIKSPEITAVRGMGLMIGVEVKNNRNAILKKMQDYGVLVIPAGDNVVRFLPPYIIEKEHVDIAVKTLEKVLQNK